MRGTQTNRPTGLIWLLTAVVVFGVYSRVGAQDAPADATAPAGAKAQASGPAKPSFEIYGFTMLDVGHDFKQIHPDWYDTMRVTKLPTFENEFGGDHRAFASVRQSRLGVRSSTPTDLGELKTTFEFELFGTGVDSGQTTFRLRHAYGELGAFGAGQYWSPFMDPDVFPNSLEYWGPTGMVFFRNVHVRWMPLRGTHDVEPPRHVGSADLERWVGAVGGIGVDLEHGHLRHQALDEDVVVEEQLLVDAQRRVTVVRVQLGDRDLVEPE